uniref:Uncharacterized protein n=1 Tax=Cucumis sativus TaxID=3659 RepID=A0A0A0L437_CUCSA
MHDRTRNTNFGYQNGNQNKCRTSSSSDKELNADKDEMKPRYIMDEQYMCIRVHMYRDVEKHGSPP